MGTLRRACLLLLLLAATAWAAAQMQSVQVRKGQLRDKPAFLAAIVADVAYGDRLEVLEQRSGWCRVRDKAGRTGWIHGSALSEKAIVLKSGQTDVSGQASGQEIVLAGKGFSEQVEKAYRSDNPAANYAWVDRMESWTVPVAELEGFARAGGLGPREGGAP